MIASSHFKINLGLYVTRKREDGFHDLETIFYPVDNECDTIEMEQYNEVGFSMEGADFEVEPEKNICVKAFRLLQQDFGLKGAKIRLRKRIPSGAGLGGGSADAATVLKMTNELFNLQISNELLEKYAAKLGSDVAFFIRNKPAYATGRGELLTPIALDLSGKCISVFKPVFAVSTAEAYAHTTPREGRKKLTEITRQPARLWQSELVNDFEEALFPIYPQLAAIKRKFYELGAAYASLSGSGSAVFAIGDAPIDLSPYFAGKTLNPSPKK